MQKIRMIQKIISNKGREEAYPCDKDSSIQRAVTLCRICHQNPPLFLSLPKVRPLKHNALWYRLLCRCGSCDTVLRTSCPPLNKKALCRLYAILNSDCTTRKATGTHPARTHCILDGSCRAPTGVHTHCDPRGSTGCRLSEALLLTADRVDLTAASSPKRTVWKWPRLTPAAVLTHSQVSRTLSHTMWKSFSQNENLPKRCERYTHEFSAAIRGRALW